MSVSVGVKVNLGFGLALVVLGLTGIGSYQSVADLVESRKDFAQTHRVLIELESIRSTVKEADAAYRAYVLTGDRSHLGAWPAIMTAAEQRFAGLRKLNLAASGSAARVDALQQMVNELLTGLREAAQSRGGPGVAPPRALLPGGDGRSHVERIQGSLDELAGEQEVAIHEQEQRARATAARANQVIVLASVLSLLVVGMSLVFINRDVRARQEVEEELHQARLHLERRVRERTAELARANEVLRQEVEERQRAEQALQQARDELERRVRERTAELARANEDLRQEIRERTLAETALRETTRLQRAILDSANHAIISIAPDGTIRTFNAAAQRWLGWTAEEVVGRHTPVLFHEPGELARCRDELGHEWGLPIDAGFEVLVTRARLGAPDEQEWTYVRRDGSRFPVLLSVTALTDETEEVSGFLVIGSDITERKRSEIELRRAMEAAETANRTKTEFLANMSHELRTPLNSVIGFTNVLLKNKAGNLRDQDLVFLQRVRDNGEHLHSLINQVLDLAKVEAGRMELELGPVALDALVRETLAQMEGQVRDKEVRLVADLPGDLAPLRSDARKLKQVLINLVGNAIKFTDRGSVTVRVGADPLTCRPQWLEVVDTGVGIPADKIESIFEAFQQVDVSTSRRYGGTGLGLSIARSLCRFMGYTIEVHSQVGAGSTFRVVLGEAREQGAGHGEEPTVAAASAAAPSSLWPVLSLQGKQVLIIDDDSDSRILLTQFVEECGCRVASVGSGEEGLHLARAFRPDLIILDLIMPGMSGWDVLKALKAHATLGTVPVVVVSIVARENRGTIWGEVDLLDKPVSREALAELLRRNLGTRHGKALVVDDSADARRLAATYLGEEGFEIREACDGREALAQLEDFSPDLIILDLLMPVMDGVEFLKTLRQDPRHLHRPVVVVTAKDLTPEEREHLTSQTSAVVSKGDDLALGLKRVVRELLQTPQPVGPVPMTDQTITGR
jgi:signal transduction histidine kinase/DNA-binding response OmpR family regulator/CHASE3 domain sensor protein